MFRRRLVVVRRPRLLGAALLGGAGFLIGRRRESQVGPAPASPPTAPAAPTTAPSLMPAAAADSVDRLGELARLHEDGSLTDEEFSQAKREVLGS